LLHFYKSVGFYILCYAGDCTPLMEAASGGYADIVKLLIDHGADVNAKSAAGMHSPSYSTVLHTLLEQFMLHNK